MVRKSHLVLAAILVVVASAVVSYAVSASVPSAALPAGSTRYYVDQGTSPVTTSDTVWHTAGGLSTSINIPGGQTGDVMILFCGRTWSDDLTWMEVRAKIGSNVVSPGVLTMAWNASYEGHCANFVKTGVAAGTKTVKIEYRSGSFHNVELGPRSMIVIVNLH